MTDRVFEGKGVQKSGEKGRSRNAPVTNREKDH